MGQRLRVLSGSDVVKIFAMYGFTVHSQSGSHIKLRRVVSGVTETLIVPNHVEMRVGTTKAVLNQGARYVGETELRKYFYSA
jgi:predicted RNA binding protein YcfA (HicA-like mRNA interferase family)